MDEKVNELVEKDNKSVMPKIDIPFYNKKNEVEVKDSATLVEKIHEKAKYDIVTNDEDVQKAILESAKKNIETEMDTISNRVEKDNNKASMERNEQACAIFGYNSKKDVIPKWQIKIMKAIYNFWFCVYVFFASFTIAPIIFVFGKLQEGIKKTWLSIIIAVLIYFIIAIGIPFIISNFIN